MRWHCCREAPNLATSFLAELGADGRSHACDAAEAEGITAVFSAIERDMGAVDALIYNAGSGAKWGTVEEVAPASFAQGWRVNTQGLLMAVQPAFLGLVLRSRGVTLR